MRTSAVVAFICLAMGVAPSFSLPSISVSLLLSVELIRPKDQVTVALLLMASNSGQRANELPDVPPWIHTIEKAGKPWRGYRPTDDPRRWESYNSQGDPLGPVYAPEDWNHNETREKWVPQAPSPQDGALLLAKELFRNALKKNA
ncbi:hypothetical protein F5148DRAFT_1370479 [Russula earlei]|uniref:Uncharacterized protein n=1 Tax=Russula earlei TaxID=71964 RepID=A0ACC0TXD7_9AGAM|nr:hypothetical protein F5148DRAFT_1370479 [Russula earlei]